jgi:hypothetical protein
MCVGAIGIARMVEAETKIPRKRKKKIPMHDMLFFLQSRNRTVCEWVDDVRSKFNISPNLYISLFLFLFQVFFSFLCVCVCLCLRSLSHLFTSSKARSFPSFSPAFSIFIYWGPWKDRDMLVPAVWVHCFCVLLYACVVYWCCRVDYYLRRYPQPWFSLSQLLCENRIVCLRWTREKKNGI